MNIPAAKQDSRSIRTAASMRRRGLSKSRFMAGMQCHKRLYLETYRPELAESADESGEATFEVGHAVGALARNRYPGGVLIGEDLDWSDAESATRDAIRNRAVPAIFEPALSLDGVRVRADVLARTRDRQFDLIEVKSTLDVKPEHEWDLAIQFHVLRGAGVPIRWARLMHLNRAYIYLGGEYDLKRLFRFGNLTRLVRKRRRKVVAALKEMRKMLASHSPPRLPWGRNAPLRMCARSTIIAMATNPNTQSSSFPGFGRGCASSSPRWAFSRSARSRRISTAYQRCRPGLWRRFGPGSVFMITPFRESSGRSSFQFISSTSKRSRLRCRSTLARDLIR